MMREADIVHETAHHYVSVSKIKGRVVYRVWRMGLTHAVLAGTFDLGDRGALRAIDDCERREREMQTQ